MRMLKSILCLASLVLTLGVNSQPPQNIADGLQQILEDALPANFSNPGGVMGVVAPGQWSWFGAAGSGIAGVTAGHPATVAQTTSRFRAGSITKNMVATCILKLEQDGLLSINDPIANYLRSTLINDTLLSSGTVTIKMLLNHTSGIANAAANNSCQLNILSDLLASHTLEEAIYCGASQGESFAPGDGWAYSNTNYSLLAMIIQEVTGLSYRQYLDQTIIQPLSLSNTEIPTTDEITGDHMGCYWYINGMGWVDLTIIDATTYTGWADVVSSTADLLTYYQALLSGNIINSAQLDKMKMIDGMADNYGLGMEFNTVDFVSYYGHYGEVANTNGMLFNELNSTIAPNGFYLVYNFNTQGVPIIIDVDRPVYHLLKGDLGFDESEINEVRVYPLPATNQFNISADEPIEALEIIDIHGRKVQFTVNGIDTSTVTVNTQEAGSGIYYLKILTGSEETIRKIVIE